MVAWKCWRRGPMLAAMLAAAFTGDCAHSTVTLNVGDVEWDLELVRGLRFWGIDMQPAIGRVAELLHGVLGVPLEQITVHDLTPYCPWARESAAVDCNVPKPYSGFPAGHATSRAEAVTAMKELAMSPWSWEKARWLLRSLLEGNDAFREADVVVCAVVSSLCGALAASGKPILMLTSWYFDHRREGDCVWTKQFTDLILCSVDSSASQCKQPFVLNRHIVMATTDFAQAYVQHMLGLKLPLLSRGLPSLSWYRAAYEGHGFEDIGSLEESVLVWPDADWKESKEFKLLQFFLRGLKSRFRMTPLTGPRQEYGYGYKKEMLLRHRALVVIPYAEWSLTVADLYWAGMPLFLPSRYSWSHTITETVLDHDVDEFGQIRDARGMISHRWFMPRSLLWSFLPGADLASCYGENASIAEAAAQVDDAFRNEDWAGVHDICEGVRREAGLPPFKCFWNPSQSNPAADAWLDTMWYYKVPYVYYWDTPEDLDEMLSRWSWEDTRAHRQNVRKHLEEILHRVGDELGSRLAVLASEMRISSAVDRDMKRKKESLLSVVSYVITKFVGATFRQ